MLTNVAAHRKKIAKNNLIRKHFWTFEIQIVKKLLRFDEFVAYSECARLRRLLASALDRSLKAPFPLLTNVAAHRTKIIKTNLNRKKTFDENFELTFGC